MDLRGYRMTVRFDKHPEYRGLGDYFGTGTPRRKTLDEWVAFAKALAAEHGGVLPNAWWIQKNHRGLDKAMRRCPERFKGIPQKRLIAEYRTLDEWIAFAKDLAAEYGGVLPNVTWIYKNHPGLYNAMRRRPERFEGIPKTRLQAEYKTLDEWVALAKQLAAEHGGVLPNVAWIMKNHPGLASAMNRYPERFEGFKQEVRDNQGRLTSYRGGEEE
jgi:hypothetical protein